MVMILSGNGPVAGTIARGETLADKLLTIPAFVGAWTAEGLPDGAIDAWPAAVGPESLTQSTAVRRPSGGVLSGQRAAIFSGAHALTSADLFADGQSATIAMRCILTEPGTDLQYLWSLSAAYRLLWRTSAGGRYQFDAGTDILLNGSGTGIVDVILSQTSTTSTLDAEGASSSAANAGIVGAALVIGAQQANPTANGLRGGVTRLAVARSAVLGTAHEAAVRAWLDS